MQNPKNIVIFGGRGVMGSITGHLFRRAGHTITSLGSRDWEAAPAALAKADVCIISVPVGSTEEIIRRAAPFLRPDCILTDVTSVKEAPVRVMLEAHSGPVLGLHPMFGEGSETFANHTVISCEGRIPEASQWILDLIAADGAHVVHLSATEHDSLMAYIQALRFFVMFSWGTFLKEEGLNHAQITALSSPVNRINMYEVGRFFNKTGPLYPQIMTSDQLRRDTIQRFADAVTRYAKSVSEAHPDVLEHTMDDVRTWLGDFCAEAQKKTDHIINLFFQENASTTPPCPTSPTSPHKLPSVTSEKIILAGKWLDCHEATWADRNGTPRTWEYVSRKTPIAAVVVIPWIMPDEKLVFIRQYRVPLDKDVIEFPAGLVDDAESPADAALRELREETGYTATIKTITPPTLSSPGLTNESVRQVVAHIDSALPENKMPQATPEGSESITVHPVPRHEIAAFLQARLQEGCLLDSKVVAYCLGMGICVEDSSETSF